jgi:mannose-1-phosphate guanylyltransferase
MRPHNIIPVILCGGLGRRLRPFSTPSCPKPFLKWRRGGSMLQKTILRVRNLAAPVLVLNAALSDRTKADMAEIGITPQSLILEPVGRNTAPALAAVSVLHDDSDILLILPSDHDIRNPDVLFDSIRRAAPFAAQGHIIAFGIRPRCIETGFGYIRRGAAMDDGLYRIERFIEKPPYDVARNLVQSGNCDWNSGMFLLSAKTARDELQRFESDLLSHVKDSVQSANRIQEGGTDYIALGSEFASSPSRSIDIAIMERSDKTLVMPIDLIWSDLGTWPALLRRLISKG